MENVTAKLIINSTQIPNVIIDEWLPTLTGTEFRILIVIARQTYGWHKDTDYLSYSQLIKRTGSANGSIGNALKSLREKGFIKVMDSKGKQLFTKEECRGQELHYQIGVTSPKIGDHLSKNWTPKTGDTKETNTKTLSKDNGRVGKKPTCPLLNGSPLKSKYPNGHTECEEYVDSEEKDRGLKFINRPKQYAVIHKILRAGYGFDVMDKTIRQVEKKYGKGAWDYATLASWIEKGSANA